MLKSIFFLNCLTNQSNLLPCLIFIVKHGISADLSEPVYRFLMIQFRFGIDEE